MVTLIDLKKSINKVLTNKFPLINLYSNDTKEGFKRPAFFTQVVPLNSENDTVNFTSNHLMVAITYFSEKETELENLRMHDEIKKAFGMTLKVNERSFLIKNIRSEIVDEVLQFRFNLDYFINVNKIDTHIKAKEVDVEMEKE